MRDVLKNKKIYLTLIILVLLIVGGAVFVSNNPLHQPESDQIQQNADRDKDKRNEQEGVLDQTFSSGQLAFHDPDSSLSFNYPVSWGQADVPRRDRDGHANIYFDSKDKVGSVLVKIRNVDALPLQRSDSSCILISDTQEFTNNERRGVEVGSPGGKCASSYSLVSDPLSKSRYASCEIVEAANLPVKIIKRWTEIDKSCTQPPAHEVRFDMVKTYTFYLEDRRIEFEFLLFSYRPIDDPENREEYDNFDFLPFQEQQEVGDKKILQKLREFDSVINSIRTQ